ncbi:hypothetical protein GGR04_002298 [Aureimonas pseudogalii]|uniref:Uncharacterized protein n=1 Tax=Aureimonas pseudogalii TaxID=1744844 RepID=A0A7W6EFG7_9HYPH|nr:hypothetical protein [Aureimonas pseudogalii]
MTSEDRSSVLPTDACSALARSPSQDDPNPRHDPTAERCQKPGDHRFRPRFVARPLHRPCLRSIPLARR